LALANKQFFSFFAIPNSGLEPWNRWAYSVELQKAAGMAGVLYYMAYKYAFYGFGMPVTTKLYLMIIAVFSLSGLALVSGMFNLDVEATSRRFSPRTPGKPIAVYLFYVAVMVSFLARCTRCN
jgi:hypothetical protein